MEISVPVPCIFLSLNFGSINRDEYLNSLPFGVLNKSTSVTHGKGGNKCKEKAESRVLHLFLNCCRRSSY
jgi:hypothetical protein